MHVVVQRQLTDVSDSTKNNLPQLLTVPQIATYAWSLARRLRHIAADVQGYLQEVRREGPCSATRQEELQSESC